MDEAEVRRTIHARYKAKCAELRELQAENARLAGRVRQLEDMIKMQGEIVALAEQVLGLVP